MRRAREQPCRGRASAAHPVTRERSFYVTSLSTSRGGDECRAAVLPLFKRKTGPLHANTAPLRASGGERSWAGTERA